MRISKFGAAMAAVIFAAAMGATALALLALGPAYAQEDVGGAVSDTTQLIISVGALVGSVATIVSLVGSRILVNHADNKLLQKVVYHADGLKGTDEALAEAKCDIATILEMAVKTSPAFAAELVKHRTSIQHARATADEFKRDTDRLYKVVEKYT